MPEITTANRLKTTGEYYFSKKMRQIAQMQREGVDVLNLGIGNPDLPPAPEVIAELVSQASAPINHGYQSYSGIPELRRAYALWYAGHFGVSFDPENQLLPLMGSKEGITHIVNAFVNPGETVLLPNPGYPTYRSVSQLAGAQVIDYMLCEENNWMPNLQAIRQVAETENLKLMFLNYPHMPTGTRPTKAMFAQLIELAREFGFILVNDNPYNFILNADPISIFSNAGAQDVVLELNSMSKSFNMAGWRIGMLAGKAEFIKAVLLVKSNMDSGMFYPLQKAAVKALQLGSDWFDQLNVVYKERKVKALELLNRLNCTVSGQQSGMFLWAKIPQNFVNSIALSDHVLDKAHVFITPGSIFGSQGDQYVRISLCTNVETLDIALNRIKNCQRKIA